MVSTVTRANDSTHRAVPGLGYDGVVKVSAGGYYGTGVLLSDGQAVLTAAHLFDPGVTSASVTFETTAGSETLTASRVTLHPDYDPVNGNHDLALVWLDQSAPVTAERYGLYRSPDEIGQVLTLVGYGTPGTGANGTIDSYSGESLRLMAFNTFDAGIETLDARFGRILTWEPASGTQLIADFDDGSSRHDALGQLLDLDHLGIGVNEGLISPGDSGGPAFVDGRVAGIASYTASINTWLTQPDVDNQVNSSFGEIASWQRVSHYQQWIDLSLRANYTDAPSNVTEVSPMVQEGDSGTSHAYFLLEFNGTRSGPEAWLSVDYATRDGTAVAGQDYLPVSETLVLYPGEDQAVIAVEVIGDTTPEEAETFFLDVFNPVGADFGAGVTQLSATRIIVDDDWWG
ncbi:MULTISPECIES: trypsin-like serine protease [Marichromatium]|uniref:Trypsin n=1 Tax=Marichromatium gracile TaxID=1048 RepID=A0A4R4ALH1_MARGR|nr:MULTISPECIES: trypsin-like serine protease [Marichromatium]MBK1707688.1 sodium:calcium exchanger [Marichromatium gracile]RNE92195.1 sodium:calcium exchanger [Marichromatium sp. AB31]TCW39676.1 trypsin [Marichromatium gracile]